MMNFDGDDHDRENDLLRVAFDVLRAADEPEIPPFERVWDVARAGAGHASRGRSRRLAAAAVIALLAVGSAFFSGWPGRLFRSPEGASPEGASLVGWTSPTASLLVYGGGGLSSADPWGETGLTTATARFGADWSSPTASLLRSPGGGGGAGDGGESPSSTEGKRRES